MDFDEHSIDSEEEADTFQEEIFEAQKIIQEAGIVDEEVMYEKFSGKQNQDVENDQGIENSAPEGEFSLFIRSCFHQLQCEVKSVLLF